MPSSSRSATPSGIRSEEWQNSLFQSRQIANRLVARATISQVQYKSEKIADAVAQPIDRAVDNFFRDLASHMGRPEDLAAQVPEVPGIRPWNPLSLDYVKAKGTSAFWLYVLAPKVVAARTTSIRKLHGRDRRYARKEAKSREENSLINVFNGMSGNSTFGGAVIKLTDPEGFDYEYEVRTGRYKRSSGTSFRAVTDVRSIAAYKMRINIRLWSALPARELSRIESWLVESGKISGQTLIELTNPKGLPRPLIRPWMAYYSQVLIPGVIREALKNFKLLDRGQIGITGNRLGGTL